MHDVATLWDANRDRWQRLLYSQPIPPRRAQVDAPTAIPVTVTLRWERDGEEERHTVAWGWTSRVILIELVDPRWQTIGAWLPATHVRRREPTGNRRDSDSLVMV